MSVELPYFDISLSFYSGTDSEDETDNEDNDSCKFVLSLTFSYSNLFINLFCFNPVLNTVTQGGDMNIFEKSPRRKDGQSVIFKNDAF